MVNEPYISLTCQNPEEGLRFGPIDGHEWCQKFQPRRVLDDDTEMPCQCECHKQPSKQGELWAKD